MHQAQLALLRGTARLAPKPPPTGTEEVRSRGETPAPRPFTPDPKAPYAHPYYWAPSS